MRLRHAAIAVAALAATAAAIMAGGRLVLSPSGKTALGPGEFSVARVEPGAGTAGPEAGPPIEIQAEHQAARPGSSRTVKPQVVAPPAIGDEPLQRTAPRPPLSDLALAQPPRPPPPAALKDRPLFRPVVVAAGRIEAGGHRITLAGVDIVEPDEICTDATGKAWACGLAARTAFRAFLRGRAIVCAAKEEGTGEAVTASCSLGKRDLGQWLVQNGWVRALPAGPYDEDGKAAHLAGKGIYGPAPDLSGLPPPPPAERTEPPAPPALLDPSGTAAMPPTGQPAPAR